MRKQLKRAMEKPGDLEDQDFKDELATPKASKGSEAKRCVENEGR